VRDVSPALQQAVDEIRGAGVEPTLAEIVHLAGLVDQLRGGPRHVSPYLESPVIIGNLCLHPMTWGAWLWLEEAEAWWREDGKQMSLAIAFALAHGRSPEVLTQLGSPALAASAIRLWVRRLNVSMRELSAALDKALPADDDDAEQRPKVSVAEAFGDVAALLVAKAGLQPRQILWEMSIDAVSDLLRRVSGTKKDDAGFIAFAKLRRAVNEIKGRAAA
jgi:hypothetical protein